DANTMRYVMDEEGDKPSSRPKANLYLTSTCPAIPKGEKKWESYYFKTAYEMAYWSDKNAEITTFINDQPFTGFLYLVNEGEKDVFSFLQFDKGRFEAVNKLPYQNEAEIFAHLPHFPEKKPAPKPNDISPIKNPTKPPHSQPTPPIQNPTNPIKNPIKPPYPDRQPVKKPVLYLYPTETQALKVQLDLTEGNMMFPYPAYNKGWEVIAQPDGTLKNVATGRTHYCLFWEMEGTQLAEKIEKGFVVKKEETTAFLEEKLAQLGLTEKEANEFIIFWLPILEQNPYNLIYFASAEYEKVAKLRISPQPETQIRVMMFFQAAQEKKEIEAQVLPQRPERKGFTVVEWGGVNIPAKEEIVE
ncbi:MAG: hypothetical protein ACKVTZ_20015, partial [Bacteroidia bacterium]